ncbi:AP2/B3-like transcriptional factor family protein isoform 2 [Hibiscus syriacus]|uniref:AP2/B3-like transcriptional factor family protein isoform 2 n=1 Tax=Hibiscus syriacus TaxID=106335 RepID=A0A6A3B1J2_HIBSY|nr:AP2/B3-like transcriptional factor family protein isoform 2 [Hibiscus syriacus]
MVIRSDLSFHVEEAFETISTHAMEDEFIPLSFRIAFQRAAASGHCMKRWSLDSILVPQFTQWRSVQIPIVLSRSPVGNRFWPNNNSRMYVLENTGKPVIAPREFVSTHGLQLGDFIMVYQDSQNQNYVIQAKKASDEVVYSDIAINGVNDLFLDDYELGKFSSYCYPTIEDCGISFIYDTTLIFSNDCPLDFLGGSMANYSSMGSMESIGSVENLSLDEFYQL